MSLRMAQFKPGSSGGTLLLVTKPIRTPALCQEREQQRVLWCGGFLDCTGDRAAVLFFLSLNSSKRSEARLHSV